MKKKLLALLLAAALCLGLCGAALAAESDGHWENDPDWGPQWVEDKTDPNPGPDPNPDPVDPGTSGPNPVIPVLPGDVPGGDGSTGSTASQPSKPSQEPDKDPGQAPDENPPEENPPAPAMSFVDVKAGDWFYGAVQYVFEKGIMTGDGSATTFNPNGKMTRAMVWTVLGRLSGADVSGTGGTWYAKAQSWAISNEVSDGTNPNGSITREELVTMLWRYTGSPAASADLSMFSDSASVSSWANAAVQWAVSTGILTGDNGQLKPGSSATRAEVATILMRYCEMIAA